MNYKAGIFNSLAKLSNEDVIAMIDSITSTALSLQQYRLEAEIGARLAKTAKQSIEAQGAALIDLLDSAKMMELSVNPQLGTGIDILA